jgi:APA family basic amino acid/polyamine antiporter
MSKDKHARQLGFWMALALVVGNIIGAGIFLLPSSLAPLGQNAIYGWLLTIAGCLCIAWVFAQLSAGIAGGPYAYVREAGGETAAFAVMWSYWVSIWTAIPALAIAGISALSSVLPALGQPLVAPVAAIAAIWLFTLVNMRGARSAGDVQLVTTVLKILPLVAVILLAAILFGRGDAAARLAPLPVSPGSIAEAATLAVFAMVGLEAATLPVGKIRNPGRTVPLATLGGTALAGLLYLAAVAAILFLLPAAQAAASPAPFADAIAPALGPWAGKAMALFVAISALGCLNGWVLCSGEVPLALARDGVFPAWFARTTAIGTPVRGQIASSLIASLLVASNASRSLSGLFTFIVLISTVATLVLYAACAGSALVLLARERLRGAATGLVALFGLLFSLWAFWGAGAEASLWGLALVATGIPVYFVMRWRAGSSPVPAAVPAAPPESAA